MSRETSPKNGSQSDDSSPNAVYMLRSEKESADLILFGASVTKHTRSATVRRASGGSLRKKEKGQRSQDDFNIPSATPPPEVVSKHTRSATVRRASSGSMRNKENAQRSQDDFNLPSAMPPPERYRRSLDSTYRQSLESISEYKAHSSFSSSYLGPRESVSSTCSDSTDYATRSTTNKDDENKTFASPSSASYLSWIESVNSEFFTTTNTNMSNNTQACDNKVGEWNNFWLNYNNPSNRRLSSPYVSASNEDRTCDDVSDCKSTCSTQRDFNEKIINDKVVFTIEEVQEALHCSQRINEILQKAMKRGGECTENDVSARSRQDSYYSQQTSSFNEESLRERSYSYPIEPQDLQKQKNLLKPLQSTATQQSSNSCINVLLNSGVADILKRVMNKRRDVDPSTPRSSFSGWSNSAK